MEPKRVGEAMKRSKLSPPIELIGNTLDEKIDYVYDIFDNAFMKKDSRPHYKGKFIFFNMEKLAIINGKKINLTKCERFYHIISIDKKESVDMFPCYNSNEYVMCNTKCEISQSKTEIAYLQRVECLYRLSRIHRINEVINLANENDENIEQWEMYTRDNKNKIVCKAYIRYNLGNDDFIVILKKENKKEIESYTFITAFPVFLKGSKRKYDREYKKFNSK